MKSLRFVSLLLALVACGDDDGRVPDSGVPGVDGGPIPGVDGGGPIPGVDGGPIPGVDGGPIPGVDAGPRVDGGGTVTPGGPDSAGPFTVARQTAMVSGSSVTAFVPAVSSPVPLVIFKHGFQLATSNYATSLERLASHGFVVVGVDSSGGLFEDQAVAQERERSGVVAAIDWATTSAPFASSVDDERIGVGGHSRGGKISVMVAASDPRVDAVLLLDPVNGCGMSLGGGGSPCPDITQPSYAGALRMPVGVMGETNNATGGFMPCAPADQNYQTIFDAITMSSWAVEWTFTGADHMDFTDDGGGLFGGACTDGPGDDAMIRAQWRAMTVAFFRRHLVGETTMDPWLTGAMVGAGITVDGP
jgi:predicted dienelactone hydrolase